MAATSALTLKTAAVFAICVMLLVQTIVGLGYPTLTAPAPAGGGLLCPDAQIACRTKCLAGCDKTSPVMCQAVLPAASTVCVDKVFSACITFCKNLCESISSP